MIGFILPWPTRVLWPNARPHWAQKARAVKSYRNSTRLLLIDAQNRAPGLTVGATDFHLTYTFCAPTRRAFDLDNALAAMKAATDGIAEALCVNDHRFTFRPERGEVVRGGAVRVSLTWDK